jgi:heme-degrading monooxygenase HmoA
VRQAAATHKIVVTSRSVQVLVQAHRATSSLHDLLDVMRSVIDTELEVRHRSGRGTDNSEVLLDVRFQVTGDPAEFERVFAATAAPLTRKSGFIGYRLVRSVDDPGVYVNVADWPTSDDLHAATKDPGFAENARALRALARSEGSVCQSVK